MKRLLAALLLIATPVAAQQTRCVNDATGALVCTAQPPASPERCAGGDWWLVDCSAGEHRAAKARADLKKRVGSMLAANDCDGALKAALDAGDFDLAGQVRGFCQK